MGSGLYRVMGKHEIFKNREVLEIQYPPIKESRMSKAINYFGQLFVIAISVPLLLTLLAIAYKCLKIAIHLDINP